MGPDYDIPQQRCSRCKHPLDEACCTGGDHKPTPGMISICVECGKITIFDEQLRLREPSEQELLDIGTRSDIVELQLYIASLHK
jgi:hypothetical protein